MTHKRIFHTQGIPPWRYWQASQASSSCSGFGVVLVLVAVGFLNPSIASCVIPSIASLYNCKPGTTCFPSPRGVEMVRSE